MSSRRQRIQGLQNKSGFTLIEVLIAITVLSVGILGTAALFPSGYSTVAGSGQLTMAGAAVQQILEDLRTVNFNNLPVFDTFDTGGTGTAPINLPAADPMRTIARKWGYALDGGVGVVNKWALTATEQSIWVPLSAGIGTGTGTGVSLSARGAIAVVNINVAGVTVLRQVNVTVTLPGGKRVIGSSLYANMVL